MLVSDVMARFVLVLYSEQFLIIDDDDDLDDLLMMTILFSSARLGLMHIGVFILLLLSGERNFGRCCR